MYSLTHANIHTKKHTESLISLYLVLGNWLAGQKGLEKLGIECRGWEQEGLEQAVKPVGSAPPAQMMSQ